MAKIQINIDPDQPFVFLTPKSTTYYVQTSNPFTAVVDVVDKGVTTLSIQTSSIT
jgi:hypothetical protein